MLQSNLKVHTIELDPAPPGGGAGAAGANGKGKAGGKGKGKAAAGGGDGGDGGYQLAVGRKSMGICKGTGPASLMSWDVAKAPSANMATGGSSCLLRCSSTSKDLVVVFELAMTVVRIDDEDAAPVEVSCGWSELALFASTADTYIGKGSYERLVYGGNLCEKLPIDGSDPDPVPTGKSSFFGKKKTIKPQAKLNIELRDPGKGLAGSIDQLPGTLLVREQLIPLIVLYRQTLAGHVGKKKSTEPLCDPFLAGRSKPPP